MQISVFKQMHGNNTNGGHNFSRKVPVFIKYNLETKTVNPTKFRAIGCGQEDAIYPYTDAMLCLLSRCLKL